MYQALYRKYRPKTFDDVVGQDFVIKTLKNEIMNNKINHAYMFFGPRGIGKTTIAKIFARAVNCENSIDGSPCGNCDCCKASIEKECVDIIEIDAASNNGVDEIREIRSKVNLVPTKLKYKVYIIDEVHMLTQGAFNALLKTLEEPPEHIIFILATTDPQKVSDTIISRCQCFSFKRISEQDNINRLKEICKKEKIEVSEDVLKEISLYSDGGLRDSLGLLDKLSSYKNTNITLDDFYDMNDMINKKMIEDLVHLIVTQNIAETIEQIEKYSSSGKNIIEIMNQLLNYLKNVVIDYYINKTPVENIEFKEQLLEYINENMFDIKKTSKPYIYVEIMFLKFMSRDNKNIFQEMKNEAVESKLVVKEKTQKITQISEEEQPKSIETEKNQKENNDVEDSNSSNTNQIDMKKIMEIRVNNCLATATKQEKNNDIQLINTLNDYIFDTEVGYVATEILNATLCASSENIIILSYEYDSVVSQNIDRLEELTNIYNKLTNSNKKLAIITNENWNKIKNEYIEFTKQGNKYKIIEEPSIQKQEENKEIKNESTSSAIELFGDIVEIN